MRRVRADGTAGPWPGGRLRSRLSAVRTVRRPSVARKLQGSFTGNRRRATAAGRGLGGGPHASGAPTVTGRITGVTPAADGLVVTVEPDGDVPAQGLTYHYIESIAPAPSA